MSERVRAALAAVLIALLCAGCGNSSPFKGEGELWIYKKGVANCVRVESVKFIASKWTKYTTIDGIKKSTGAPVEYYAGGDCT